MKTQEIANKLVAYCRDGKFEDAQRSLFSDDAVSTEPKETKGFSRETKGLPAIIDKGHMFAATLEKVHSVTVSNPLVADHVFACTMSLDVTTKEDHKRSTMSELCVYEVKNDKIVSEHFHW